MLASVSELIGTQPILALFLAIGLGYAVGQINVLGFSLGVGAVLFVGALIYGFRHGLHAAANATVSFGLQQFAAAFLNEYWLQFELTSVLLLAAMVGVILLARRRT